MDMFTLNEFNDRVSESAEQDKTARMGRLILLYTLRKKKKKINGREAWVKA